MNIENIKFLGEARAIVNDRLYQFYHCESDYSDGVLRFKLLEGQELSSDIVSMPVKQAIKYGFIS